VCNFGVRIVNLDLYMVNHSTALLRHLLLLFATFVLTDRVQEVVDALLSNVILSSFSSEVSRLSRYVKFIKLGAVALGAVSSVSAVVRCYSIH